MRTQTIRDSFVVLLGSTSALALIGCQMSVPNTPEAPATQNAPASYVTVEYPRFVSGVSVNEFKNKYVQVDCRFGNTKVGNLPGGYSPDRYLSFLAVNSDNMSQGAILHVIVPKHLADIVFSLKAKDKLRVRGRAVELTTQSGAAGAFKRLGIEATSIETIN